MAQTVKHLPTMRETWVPSLGREDPLEKEMAPHSSTLAWKIPWTEDPGHGGHKESDTTELLHFHFQGDTERSLVLRSLGMGKDAPLLSQHWSVLEMITTDLVYPEMQWELLRLQVLICTTASSPLPPKLTTYTLGTQAGTIGL